jgi:hypothetical protein
MLAVPREPWDNPVRHWEAGYQESVRQGGWRRLGEKLPWWGVGMALLECQIYDVKPTRAGTVVEHCRRKACRGSLEFHDCGSFSRPWRSEQSTVLFCRGQIL